MNEETTKLGPFILGECIGSGGMGKIYRATHQVTGVEVAVKVIRGGTTPESEDLFEREVQAQAGLAHPGLVYLFDCGIVSRPGATSRRVATLWAVDGHLCSGLHRLRKRMRQTSFSRSLTGGRRDPSLHGP